MPRPRVATIGYIVSGQDEGTVRRMKDAYDRLVEPHLDRRGCLSLATAALLGSGTVS